jgi:hypothetical protein
VVEPPNYQSVSSSRDHEYGYGQGAVSDVSAVRKGVEGRGEYPSIAGIMESHLDFGDGVAGSTPHAMLRKSRERRKEGRRGSLELPMMEREQPSQGGGFKVAEGVGEEGEEGEEEVDMDEWVIPGSTSYTPPGTSSYTPSIDPSIQPSLTPSTITPSSETPPFDTDNSEPPLSPETAKIELEALKILAAISNHLSPSATSPSIDTFPKLSPSSPPLDNVSIRSWREARKRALHNTHTHTNAHTHTHTRGSDLYRPAPLPPPLSAIPPIPSKKEECAESAKRLSRGSMSEGVVPIVLSDSPGGHKFEEEGEGESDGMMGAM